MVASVSLEVSRICNQANEQAVVAAKPVNGFPSDTVNMHSEGQRRLLIKVPCLMHSNQNKTGDPGRAPPAMFSHGFHRLLTFPCSSHFATVSEHIVIAENKKTQQHI